MGLPEMSLIISLVPAQAGIMMAVNGNELKKEHR